ncbi:MAG: heme exporter protein CcmD [Parvibaculum sp.]|uniref:heme exporter protein CcmD n=1 Tax=Parvibaculum sp. TaxID=2024848 RepID=UPI003C759783
MAAFLDMGGYAVFIWPCYAIAAIVMIGLVVQSLADLRAQRRLVSELEAGQQVRPRARARSGSGRP